MPSDVLIQSKTIDLDQFLKLAGVAQTGGHAKYLIKEDVVTVNGEIETRRRRTLHVGDVVAIQDEGEYRVSGGPTED
ncbi:MAG: RNA-binding S4 domain-containing protein [Planctomycetota bacterium]|jgi:ribosome-associated protein